MISAESLPSLARVSVGGLLLAAQLAAAETLPRLEGVRRIVFLGDSITYGGQYVEYVETWFLAQRPRRPIEFLNLGLPSETVSGLSEPGHAGGAFPRPCLDERLARVLARTKPDLVVACYGMNDGIYHPLEESRLQRFRDGMQRLRGSVVASGAKLVVITPPVFDPEPIRADTLPAGQAEYRSPYVGYNEVLDAFAAWLLAQRGAGWEVVDAHGPMNRFLAERRRSNPAYRLADDGVHVNATGHWLIAREFLAHLGADPSIQQADGPAVVVAKLPNGPELFRLVHERQSLLKDAWLTAVGHERPGMNRGLPLSEAQTKAAEIAERIRAVLAPQGGAAR